jgi:hypothetical protein
MDIQDNRHTAHHLSSSSSEDESSNASSIACVLNRLTSVSNLLYHTTKNFTIPHPNLIKFALPYHKKLYHTTSQFNQNRGLWQNTW